MKNLFFSGKKFIIPLLLLCWISFPDTCAAQRGHFIVDSLTTVIDAANSPFNMVLPGDTIFLTGGRKDYLLIRNFQGVPGNPITFMNSAGVVIIDTDHYFGISVENCRYFRITGTGSEATFYGFQINRVSRGAGIGVGKLSSDFELDHLSVKNVLFGAIIAKTDPSCLFNSTREKFTQYNTAVHDCYISNSGNEGMYIGSTKYFGQVVNCDGKDTLLLPSLLDGVRVYNNIVESAGWDGIQVSSASNNCQVYDNLILHDSQDEHYGQMAGIMLGGGSKCDCYNNYISDGKGIGIESHGLGGYRIFNNIIVNAGKSYKPYDSLDMKFGIFITDTSVIPDSSFYLLFNDIINPKSDGIRFSSTLSRHNLVASNVIINPGNFDFYEHGNTGFIGKDAYVMLPDHSSEVNLKNNYFSRTSDSAGFSATNYTLQPGSPLIDAGYFENKGVTYDFYHHARPYGKSYDIGAHEFNPAFLDISENKPPSATKISLYPNPVRDSFSIRFQVTAPSKVIFDMYNLQGTNIDSSNWRIPGTGSFTKTVNVANLPDGIYLFMLRIGTQSHSGRFVKVSRK